MRAIAYTYTQFINRLIALFAALIALSLFLYGIFLLEAVAHTAAHAESVEEMARVSARLSLLEMEYLKGTRALTPEYARELGFTSPITTSRVYASSPTLTLSPVSEVFITPQ